MRNASFLLAPTNLRLGDRMKTIKHYGMLTLVFTVMWVVLNEKASAAVLLSGLVFSAITLFLTDYFLSDQHYIDDYSVRIQVLIKYVFYLIFQIYKSGFSAIMIIIKGQGDVHIIDHPSKLDDELSVCLLANSITLTPGTVTLDKSENLLKVLAFSQESQDQALMKFEDFERVLGGLRR